jgi:hypothetical protein
MKKLEPYPTAVPTNRHGSYLVICSDACMAILESEYLAGIHLAKTDIPVSDFCQVCSVCGELCIKVAQCLMHETSCPTVQWKQTIEGINTAREVARYFSFDFVEEALDVIYDFIRRKPGTDPIALLKRMTR